MYSITTVSNVKSMIITTQIYCYPDKRMNNELGGEIKKLAAPPK